MFLSSLTSSRASSADLLAYGSSLQKASKFYHHLRQTDRNVYDIDVLAYLQMKRKDFGENCPVFFLMVRTVTDCSFTEILQTPIKTGF